MNNQSKSQKICKNVLQYGFCRNDKCEFSHDIGGGGNNSGNNSPTSTGSSNASPTGSGGVIISPPTSNNSNLGVKNSPSVGVVSSSQSKKNSSPILPPNPSMEPLINSLQNTSLYHDDNPTQTNSDKQHAPQQQHQPHWTDNISGITEFVPKSFYNNNNNNSNINTQPGVHMSGNPNIVNNNINNDQYNIDQQHQTNDQYQAYQQLVMRQMQMLKQQPPQPPIQQSPTKLQQPSPQASNIPLGNTNTAATTTTSTTGNVLQQQQQQQNSQAINSPNNPNNIIYTAQQIQQPFNPYPNYSNQNNLRFKPGRRTLGSFFMSENLKQELQNRKVLLYETLDPNDPRTKNIPPMLNKYHSLFPLDLDNSRENQGKMFGYPTSMYKAISTFDGMPYAIRRVEGFRLSSEFALQAADSWRNVQHPNVVSLNEIFVSKEFGDNASIFFAYEFYPGSETLESKFLTQPGPLIKESVLWSFICQLVSALKTIHSSGLVCRVIHPSKIILTGKNRIRINGVGIFDVVNFDTPRNLSQYQHEDLLLFGRLILTLACRSSASTTASNLTKSIDFLSANYTKELYNLVYLLMKPAMTPPTIDDVVTLISGKLLLENNYLHQYADDLETELTKEYENGRLFRVLTKLGFINERPMYDMDQRWSETGDRYLIKLFRDFVFHQVYEDGTPVLDYYHVVESLNKLDTGAEEKILLMSRDEQSILVVSYKDMKKCIESAFNELVVQKSTHQ